MAWAYPSLPSRKVLPLTSVGAGSDSGWRGLGSWKSKQIDCTMNPVQDAGWSLPLCLNFNEVQPYRWRLLGAWLSPQRFRDIGIDESTQASWPRNLLGRASFLQDSHSFLLGLNTAWRAFPVIIQACPGLTGPFRQDWADPRGKAQRVEGKPTCLKLIWGTGRAEPSHPVEFLSPFSSFTSYKCVTRTQSCKI